MLYANGSHGYQTRPGTPFQLSKVVCCDPSMFNIPTDEQKNLKILHKKIRNKENMILLKKWSKARDCPINLQRIHMLCIT